MHCLFLYLYAHEHLSLTCRQVYDPLYNEWWASLQKWYNTIMKKNLDMMKPFIVNVIYFASPLGCYIEIPL